MTELFVKINFGIAIFLCINQTFNDMLNDNIYSTIHVTLDDEIFDKCRQSYGEVFKKKMYDIMKIIFINKNIKIYDYEADKTNINFIRMCVGPNENSYKYKINNSLVNFAYSKKNVSVPEKFITITTKIMDFNGTITNFDENNKRTFYNILNSIKLPKVIIGEKHIEFCDEYNILKPYSIYNDLIENLNNYLDFTINSSVNNNDINELCNTIYILNKSKLNLYFTSSGAPTIGLNCSNNILGVSQLYSIDKNNFINEDNSNIKFVRTLEEFLNIFELKINELNSL